MSGASRDHQLSGRRSMKKLFSFATFLFVLALFQVAPSYGQSQEPKELTEARNSYNADLQKAIKPVNDRYSPKLEELKKQLTFKGDIKGAVAVEDVITKMNGGQALEQQSDSDPQEMKEIKKNYSVELETAVKPVKSLYLAKLEVLKQQLALNGALKAALVVEEEMEKIKTGQLYKPSSQNVIFFDDFNNQNFKSKWKWIRRDAARWAIENSQLKVTISDPWKDLWKDINNASLMYIFEPDVDYAVETHVIGHPDRDHQQAGIVIYNTDDNYIRLTIGNIVGQKYVIYLTSEYKGVPENVGFSELIPSINTKLRIEKRGATYKALYYSDSSKNWKTVGPSLTPYFATEQNKVGVTVLASPTPITFDFQYFKVESINE